MISNVSVIREKGLKALRKELGASGMAIFIRQFENGTGDYTKEREKELKNISIDDIILSIKKRKEQ